MLGVGGKLADESVSKFTTLSLLPLLAHCYILVVRNCLPNHCRRAGAATGRSDPCSKCGRFHHTLLHSSGPSLPAPGASQSGHSLSPDTTPFFAQTSGRGGGRAEAERHSSRHQYISRGVNECKSFFQTAGCRSNRSEGKPQGQDPFRRRF